MTRADAPARDLEKLYQGGLLSRRQFVTALVGLGFTASAIAGLFGSEALVSGQGTTAEIPPEARHLVVIVMDGFRADYETLASMPNLRSLMARGMTYDTAWVGHLESETPTGHATIGTGVYPRKHGVIGFGWRDAATGGYTYMPTDLDAIRAGGLTRTIAGGGVPTISDLIRRRRHTDISISVSGEKYYASATMGAGADYVLYGANDTHGVFRPVSIGEATPPAGSHDTAIHGSSDFASQDTFSADLALQLARTLRPRALLINLPDVDIAGHYYGGMAAASHMAPIVQRADVAIGNILATYRKLGLLERTVFMVTADHGMAANRHIVPIHKMYAAVAAHAPSGSVDEEFRITMGSVWLRQPTEDRAVSAALVAARFPGVETALYKVASNHGWVFAPDASTEARLGSKLTQAYLNLADTEASPAGPEVIMPYAEDTMGLTVKNSKSWGNHGGFSWGVQHIPMVLAGPGVVHGLSHAPAKLVDVAPTLERLLGLPIPAGVDGVVLADALEDATAAEHTAQRKATSARVGDVQAIRAHSLGQAKLDT